MTIQNKNKPQIGYIIVLSVSVAIMAVLCLCAWSYAATASYSPYPIVSHAVVGIKLIALLLPLCLLYQWLQRKISAAPARQALARTLLFWVICCVGVGLRVYALLAAPVSDAETTAPYQLALLMNAGTIPDRASNLYINYIARFPYTFGYAYFLSNLFSVLSHSRLLVLIIQAALGMANALFARSIAKRVGGDTCGLFAFAWMCLWPAQILQCTQVSPVPFYTALALLTLLIVIRLLRNIEHPDGARHPLIDTLLLIFCGVAAAFCTYSALSGIAVSVAAALALIHRRKRETDLERSASSIILSRRVLCLVLFALPYLFSIVVLNQTVNDMTRQSVPGPLLQRGYSAMVASNLNSGGLWNEEDSNHFEDIANASGAIAAQQDARAVAWSRLRQNPADVLRLYTTGVFSHLWGSDEAATQAYYSLYPPVEGAVGASTEGAGPAPLKQLLERTEELRILSYVAMLLLALWGQIRAFAPARRELLPVLYLFVLLVVASFALEPESILRDAAMPVLLVLSSMCLAPKRVAEQAEAGEAVCAPAAEKSVALLPQEANAGDSVPSLSGSRSDSPVVNASYFEVMSALSEIETLHVDSQGLPAIEQMNVRDAMVYSIAITPIRQVDTSETSCFAGWDNEQPDININEMLKGGNLQMNVSEGMLLSFARPDLPHPRFDLVGAVKSKHMILVKPTSLGAH